MIYVGEQNMAYKLMRQIRSIGRDNLTGHNKHGKVGTPLQAVKSIMKLNKMKYMIDTVHPTMLWFE